MTEITVSEARDQLSDLVNKTAFGKQRFVLLRRGKKVAALVSLEDFENLERQQTSEQQDNKTC